ncbi:site-2 protease family protein [Kineococcus sp. NUM-3379]
MNTLLLVVGVLVAAVGIGVSIALHEVGHLLPAKRFGVKVTQYMVGFGPTLWSRRRGETEYGVKAIPLGGYIRMIGMLAPRPGDAPGTLRATSTGRFGLLVEDARRQSAEEIAPGEEHRAFYRLSVPKRLAIMFGGPFVNLVLAVLLIAVALSAIGTPQTTPLVSSVSQCVLPAGSTRTDCGPGDPAAPGALAGLRPGDRITTFDGRPVDDWLDVSAAIRASGGRPVQIGVERAGGPQTLTATPVLTERPVLDEQGNPTGSTARVGFLGVSPSWEIVRRPLGDVPGLVWQQTASVAGLVLNLPQRLVGVAQAAFGSGERDPNGPMGVVGLGRVAGELNQLPPLAVQDALAERASRLLMLLASLNIALFVFNMIPLLPFDGGHIAGALWEAVKRGTARLLRRPDPGPVDVAKALPVAYAVSVLLIGMSLLLLYADIVRPVRLSG